MTKTLVKTLAAVMLWLGAPLNALGADLLLGYGSHFDAPYTVIEDGELTGGWIHATASALSKSLQTPVSAVAIPRKRSSDMINSGDIDLYCFTNPAWARDMHSVRWTERLFDVSNLVIVRNDVAKSVRSPYDLRGYFVGTILGYSYRPLTPFFDSGQIQRVDTKSFDQNLKMLRNGRVEAAIVPDTVAENLLLRLGMDKDFSAALYMVSRRSLHCAISGANPEKQGQLTEALKAVKGSGLFDWPELRGFN
ncbi:transporter substrate-binding domain-containing protein [Magnetovibrio sp. PR-2]|uniref:substrate-binding periplasmic protein n=1 Tax=Magnetovibrio sp. PR-2 TaxID=3120356 RepID=UPI002FCE65BE